MQRNKEEFIMRMKALIAAAAITAFTGSAIAQTIGATDPGNGEAWGSEQEQMLFEQHGQTWGGFFTDDTFTELAPEADFQATWDGLTADEQAEAMATCEQVQGAPTEYRNATVQWCESIGLL